MQHKLIAAMTTVAAMGLFSTVSASAAVIFSDNFNRANSSAVGNSWAEHEEDADDVAISTNRLQLRDHQNPAPDATATHNISTLGYNNITLAFDWAPIEVSDIGDSLFAEWRVGSSAWTMLGGTFDLGGSTAFASTGPLNLGNTADNLLSLEIRFRTLVTSGSNGVDEGAFVDNVVVSGTAITAQAVPEPLTLSLFGAGLIGSGFAAVRRRRKTKQA